MEIRFLGGSQAVLVLDHDPFTHWYRQIMFLIHIHTGSNCAYAEYLAVEPSLSVNTNMIGYAGCVRLTTKAQTVVIKARWFE